MTAAADVLGANVSVATDQLQRELKRQLRGAVNKLAVTAGADADPVIVGVIGVTGAVVGYLPFDTP